MSITLSAGTETRPAGTGTAQNYADPTLATDPGTVPPELREPAPWFSDIPAGQDGTAASSGACALCHGTGRLPGGNPCPGMELGGPPVAWVTVEQTDQLGHWETVHEGIRNLNKDAATQSAADTLLDLIVDEVRPGGRYAWRRYSVVARDDQGRSVIAYREVPPRTPDGWVYPTLTDSLIAAARRVDAEDQALAEWRRQHPGIG